MDQADASCVENVHHSAIDSGIDPPLIQQSLLPVRPAHTQICKMPSASAIEQRGGFSDHQNDDPLLM
jgi:hypothetical protein